MVGTLHFQGCLSGFLLDDLATVLTTKLGKCSLNQSKVGSFVGQVAKDGSENNGDRLKIHKVFPTNCFVFVVTLV